MANNVSNKLRIQCEDSAIMAKIKKIILRENNNEQAIDDKDGERKQKNRSSRFLCREN